MGSVITKHTRIIAQKVTSTITAFALVLMTAAPAVFAFPATAAAADGVLNVLINGAPPTGFCIAGDITISGSGTTGQQGGQWSIAIGWGDGATTTITTAPGVTSGTLSGKNKDFTFSATHTPTGPSTGIRVVLYHSQPSGQDGQVIVVNQCVAPPTQGVVILKKHVVNDDGRTLAAADFTLHINSNDVAGSETGQDFSLNAGTYPITEDAVIGYTKTGTSCVDTGTNAVDTSGSVTVVAGHNYVCTVTNDDTPVSPGTIEIVKHVVNDNGGQKIASDFTISVSGTNASQASFAGSESTTTVTVDPGTYAVTEATDAGYAATSLTDCAGTIGEGETKYCVITNNDKPATLTVQKVLTQDNGGTEAYNDFLFQVNGGTETLFDVTGTNILTVDAGTYSVTEVGEPLHGYTTSYDNCSDVVLGNGDSATCTITNDDKAPSLTLNKGVVNVRSSTANTAWTLSAIGPSTLSGASGIASGAAFAAGVYALSESGGPTFYTASDWMCALNGGDPAAATGDELALANGDTAVCTITNTEKQPGTLHVIKHVVNDNPEGYQGTATADQFGIEVTGGNADPASFSGSEDGVDVTLDAGSSYSVAEVSGPTGYTVSYSADCLGTIAAGETKTCTVTNNDNPPTTGGLTVIKEVVNDNGGTKLVVDFPLSVTDGDSNATSVTSGASNQFAAGTYIVSEVSDSSYVATFSGDCDANGSVTIENGVSKTCTIKNDDKAPSLTLVKEVVNDNGGTAQSDAWTLTATGDQETPTVLMGTTGIQSDGTFQAGTYTLVESDGPTGYSAGGVELCSERWRSYECLGGNPHDRRRGYVYDRQ